MSGSTGIAANTTAPLQRIFRITDIPDVMQFKKGWSVSAQLMRRWFASPSYTMPDDVKRNRVDPRQLAPGNIDETTVKMAWALRFGRVNSAYQHLLASWATPVGIEHLRTRVRISRPATSAFTPWRFGDLSKRAAVVDSTCQVNITSVGGLLDPLDDFYGAIGIGTLKIAMSGVVSRLDNGRERIEIDELGIYLRDLYDFNDSRTSMISQILGYWGFAGVERSPRLCRDIAIDDEYVNTENAASVRESFYAVQNDDFRAYRKKYGKGGDFVIYSDVHRVKLARPKVIDL